VILVWGPGGDPPLEMIISLLRDRGVRFAHLEDRELDSLSYDITIDARPSGWVALDGRNVALDELSAVYIRPGDPRPGRSAETAMVLLGIAATLPATVINRPSGGRSNWSKPYQLGLIAAAGLDVPPTLVTTDPVAARSFLAEHERLVYKSVSGVRSIVATLDANDSDRLDGVTTGPVQLQKWIDGLDVRVHVVADRWFATAIDSDAADYRYAGRNGGGIAMQEIAIPDDLGTRLVGLTASLGLLVSGIDLRLTPDGDWFCFEVNPSPGFSFYQEATGQPIGEAIVDLLVSAPNQRQYSARRSGTD
jgi:glutathione synthase/RimK-type ligase-like ATP-grasp enzyme